MTQHLAARPRTASRQIARLLAVGTALTLTVGLAACAPADSEQVGSAPATRTVETDFGPVEVPVDIERIVSVDFYTPAALVDVGVMPVGVVNTYFTASNGANSSAGKNREIFIQAPAASKSLSSCCSARSASTSSSAWPLARLMVASCSSL